MTSVLSVERLGMGPMPTDSPFLFAVHHLDKYPPGDKNMGPAASLRGHNIGADFGHADGWSMYHGEVIPGFPKHPHRGFETITVARQGYVDHTDSLGNGGRFGGGDVQWIVTPTANLEGRDVVILDDILDVGSTLLSIIDACKAQGAASVKTCVLVDKVHDRKAQPGLKADYTALEAEDLYLFGMGMDYKGYWRNAPGIFAVEEA